MAVLHPQECYLLEKFISPEHYAATRDAIIPYIDTHEAAFARYLRVMPLKSLLHRDDGENMYCKPQEG